MFLRIRRVLLLTICLVGIVGLTACGKKAEDEKISISEEKVEDTAVDITVDSEPAFVYGTAENSILIGKEMVEFGSFEQDNDLSNGPEAIKWIVLTKDDDKALLLSAYGLFCEVFDEGDIYSGTNWSKSTLRKECNETFFQKAFTEQEQEKIFETKIKNKPNPLTGVGGCEDTSDKVFCLSFDELNDYFDNTWTEDTNSFISFDAMCEITPFAKNKAQTLALSQRLYNREYKNAGVPDGVVGISYCNYWLRSPDMNGKGALILYYNGGNASFYEENGYYIYNVAVRPAMWVDSSLLANSYICDKADSLNKVYQVPADRKDIVSCVSFGDEVRYTLAADVEKYMLEYQESMTFFDAAGNQLFELEAGNPFELRTYYRDADYNYYTAASDQSYTKREQKKVFYTFFAAGESPYGENAMIDEAKWADVAYFNFGNGVDYPCHDNLYAKLDHNEYRLSLMDDEVKELLFKTDDDYEWLMPTTDDFKVEFFDVPKVGKLTGYTAGYDDVGRAVYGGFVDMEKGVETMPCRVINVESYDHYGRAVSFRQRIAYMTMEDCYYNLSTEAYRIYFKDYTGVDKIPENYDAAELISEINDVIQLRDLNYEMADSSIKTKRIGCAYYFRMDGEDVPIKGNGLDFFCNVDAPNLANYSTGARCFSTKVPYDYYWVFSNSIAGVRSSVCDAILFYSMPAQHIGNYYVGSGEHYEKGFPAAATDNYYMTNLKDSEYFTPASDDYFLFWKGGQFEYNNDFAIILSFNESGELIQAVKRINRPENMVNSIDELLEYEFGEGRSPEILYKDDNYAYLNMMRYAEFANYSKRDMSKIFEENTSENGGINVPTEATSKDFYIYINNPNLNSKNTYRANAASAEDFAFLADVTLYTDDYAIYGSGATSTIYASSDGKNNDTPYEVQEYKVCFFDKSGLQAENALRIVDIFKSEAEATAYEEFVKKYCPAWEPERVGKIVAVNGFADAKNKFERMEEDGDIYFSIPYYTDVQSNYLAEHGWRY